MAGGIVIERRNSTNASALAVGGRFGRFGPEKEKVVWQADIKESLTMEQLKEAWRRYDELASRVSRSEITFYNLARYVLKNNIFSARDIENFNIAIAEFQEDEKDVVFGHKAGLFLSVLMNSGKGNEHTIHTRHLHPLLSCLGIHNRKSIRVKGDIGGCVGAFMEDGMVLIEGDVGHSVGHYMRNGTIIVRGDAGNGVGHGMRGGEISIEGDYGSISNSLRSGRIYHKGELIVEK
jgi:hypothetical protein